jgi:hypothetical protein
MDVIVVSVIVDLIADHMTVTLKMDKTTVPLNITTVPLNMLVVVLPITITVPAAPGTSTAATTTAPTNATGACPDAAATTHTAPGAQAVQCRSEVVWDERVGRGMKQTRQDRDG